MGTLAGISYEELAGSGVGSIGKTQSTAIRIFKVAWADRIDFAKELVGYSRNVGGEIVYKPAERFPDFTRLYCNKVGFKGLGIASDGSAMIAYPHAIVTANYALPAYNEDAPDEDPDADTYLEETLDFATEFVSMPKQAFKWNSDNEPIDQNIGKLIGSTDLTLTRHMVPEINQTTINSCKGKVNSSTFRGAAVNTVLFMGASARRVFSNIEGAQPWTVNLKFRHREVSWNYAYRPGTGWAEITPNPYGETNLSVLLTGIP